MSDANGIAFYTTAAAVLPIFFLTLAVEQRSSPFFSEEAASAFDEPDSRRVKLFRAAYGLVVTAVLTIGEAAAFTGIVAGFPLEFHPGSTANFVLYGLVVGGFGVLAPTIIINVHELLELLEFPGRQVLVIPGRQRDQHVPLNVVRALVILAALFGFAYMAWGFVYALLR